MSPVSRGRKPKRSKKSKNGKLIAASGALLASLLERAVGAASART